MPCNTVVRMNIDFKVANRSLLKRGLEREGWTVVERRGVLYATKEGRAIEIQKDRAVVIQGDEDLVKKVTVAYAKEAARTAIAKFGWKTQAVAGKHNTWDVVKASF